MANMYGYNTSSAYKLDYTYKSEDNVGIKTLHTDEKPKADRTTGKGRSTRSLASFLKVAVCFAVAFAIVNGYVKINEINNDIAAQQADNAEVCARIEALEVKIDKAVDKEQLSTVASEKYGMIRPERDQIFYIDMEQEDFAETPGEKNKKSETSAMKGVTGSMTGALNIFD